MKTQNDFKSRFTFSLTSLAPIIALAVFCIIFTNNLLAQTKSGNSGTNIQRLTETEPLRPPGLPQTQFEISTLAHLRWLSEGDGTSDTVNTKRRYWHYVLTADIDATDSKNWNVADHDNDDDTPDVPMGFYPIGHYHSTPTRFQGSFDGQGHTISNLYIYHQSKSGDHAGLFGSVESNFYIRNIILSNVDFTCKYGGALVSRLHKGDINNCHSSGIIKASWAGIGGLIGAISYIPKVSLVVIENCSSSCTVETFSVNNTGTSSVGGFIGSLHAYHHDKVFVTMRNCSSSGTVSGHSRSTSIGGFAGKMSDTLNVENCTATGNVSGAADIGGFAGYVDGALVTIKNCNSSGEVTVNSETSNKFRIGGFIGFLGSRTIIDQCSAKGKEIVTSEEYESVGGFIGECTFGTNTVIKNSYTTCNVSGRSDIGGFIGYGGENTTIQNCYSSGNVQATKDNVGGFAGRSPKVTINCVAYGDVSGENSSNIGGFFGRGSGDMAENCYTYGDSVTGNNKVGGFVGYDGTDTVINCHTLVKIVTGNENIGGFAGNSSSNYSYGCTSGANVEATGNNVGGYAGSMSSWSSNQLVRCFATGNVQSTGEKYTGGFIGNAGSITIRECYATGNAKGNQYVGGFCGFSQNIIQCFATGNAIGTKYVAGLCGRSYNVENSFATGNVSTNSYGGSIAGYWSSVLTSYGTGSVNGSDDYIGGGFGGGNSGTRKCYFDATVNPDLPGNGDNRYPDECIGLPTPQFSIASNFDTWDFSSIWQIATIAEIDMYPRPYQQWYLDKNMEALPFTSLQIENQMSDTKTGYNQNIIQIIMPFNYDITSLALEFVVPDGTVLIINDSVQISGVTLNDFSQPVICYFLTAGTKSAVSRQDDIENEQMWIIEVENEKYQLAFKNSMGGQVLGDTLQYIKKDSATTEVLAKPASGYMFSKWVDENGNSFSTDSLLHITNVSKNSEYTALFEVTTDVNNFKQRSFNCFPLPCYNKLTVQFSKEYTGSIQILNIAGSKVKEINLEYAKTETIDISELQQGAYIIKANNNCMKIIKK